MFLDIDKKEPTQVAAVSVEGEQITYGELADMTAGVAKSIGTRNLVFVLCRNRVASLAGYVSLIGSENVPLLLSADLDAELLVYLLSTYRPNFIWCQRNRQDEVAKQIQNALGIDGSVKTSYHFSDYVLLSGAEEKPKLYEELALLLTTSGSTGSPKLVRQSYNNIRSNAESISQYLELTESERPITMLPMNYTYGLSVINSHLLVGAVILMTEDSYAQKPFWEFFKRQGATSIVGVPFTYEILKKLRFFRMDLPTLRYMTQAGGKLSPELHREYAQYALDSGKRFYVMYGQTEATARMSYLPYDKSLEKYGSMGIAIPGGAFSLIDVDGMRIAEPDVVGELVYEGPNVTLGYAQQLSDLAKSDDWNGVLVTGDMARRDEDGYYYIVGRKKRFLKIYGNRVNLDECERMIQGAFADMECACVGEDDHMRVYVTKSNSEQCVSSYLSDKMGLNRKAFEIRYISEIPKNDAGKKQYKQLII